MLKTIIIAAVLATAPNAAHAVASTYSLIALNGFATTGSDMNLTESAVVDGAQIFAQALSIGTDSVAAIYSGTRYASAYASTRYRYDADASMRVSFDAAGYINSLGLGHGSAVVAAWHVNGAGDLLWENSRQFDSCSSCDSVGFVTFSKSFSRIARAGDSLFLTITARAFSDPNAPAPSSFRGGPSFAAASDTFRQAQSMVTRTVTVSAVPEPATWGLMIAGFGLAGTTVRARRQIHATVAS